MFRELAFVAAVLLLGGCGYSRDVDRTPEQVARALSDLDITDQPGEPGSTAQSGVQPVFVHERTADGVALKVMSGKDIAITMFAHLTPLDGGKRTRVTASVERGNAADDFVSPAFRSEGLALALFTVALEDDLNDLTSPMAGNQRDCEELLARFEASNYASADLQEQHSRADAIGDVGKVVLKLHALEQESRRLGCDRFRGKGFQQTSQMMTGDGGGKSGGGSGVHDDGDADRLTDDWGTSR